VEIEFETANAGMEVYDEAPAGETISWITGFVPANDVGRLKRAAAENGWALIADDPGEEDNVPTLLKENKFAQLLRPITEFLDITPGYREVDVTLWFLIFFSVFFGMIWGDAGYGALLIIGAAAGTIAAKSKGNPVAPIIRLLWLLAVCNFAWGVLTCSWFGVDLKYIPQILKDISLPFVSNANPDADTVRHNLMIICFTLALLQLCIGHIIAIKHTKGPAVLGQIGNMCMLAGMYRVVIYLVVDPSRMPFYPLNAAIILLGAGFVLDYMFSNYETSLGQALLASTAGIINKILGIANVFSDIMSYIRLWAVALAGSAIAMVVDQMAGGMLGSIVTFIFGVILLVFGHGLNLALNVLSVVVHGVRLNTLEFSTHAGLSWAGFAYKPFAVKNEGK
jgi:V/A-type H+-transporting ATPase subunit I